MSGDRPDEGVHWPRLAGWLAVLAGLSVAWLVAPWQPAPIVALGGVVFASAGLLRRTRWLLTLGGAIVFGGAAVAGLVGAGPARTLLAGTLAVVTWDAGRYAHVLGVECAPAARPRRVQVIHIGVVTAGLAAVAAAEYLLFAGVTGGQSMLGLLGLLVGAFASLVAIQRWIRTATPAPGP